MDSRGTKIKKGSQREAYAQALLELGRRDKNIVVLDADLSRSTKTIRFKEAFPDRFFNLGVSEADMVNTAAGIASCGKIVFASSFAIFVTGKAWEEIRNTIAYSQLSVKIVATHSGIGVGADGASHQCLEDIGLMRQIPETTVVVPADPIQTKKAVLAVAEVPGLCYVRLTRQDLPIIYGEDIDFEIGKAITLREGDDITIFTIGSMVYPSLVAAEILRKRGVEARVIDMHTVKPIDKDTIIKAAEETRAIITCEDHSIIGGLGSAVAEVLCENHPKRLYRIGIPDVFGESGSYQELYKHFRLTPQRIAMEALRLLK